MRQVFPLCQDDPELPALYAYPDGPWLRANMVSSADGAAMLTGLTAGLSSQADRRLFALPDMIRSFKAMLARERGEVTADVTVPGVIDDKIELRPVLGGLTDVGDVTAMPTPDRICVRNLSGKPMKIRAESVQPQRKRPTDEARGARDQTAHAAERFLTGRAFSHSGHRRRDPASRIDLPGLLSSTAIRLPTARASRQRSRGMPSRASLVR